jgi:hypothetical protein
VKWRADRSGYWLIQDDPNCTVTIDASNMFVISGNGACDGSEPTKTKTECGADVHVRGWNCRTKWAFAISDGKVQSETAHSEPPHSIPFTVNIGVDPSNMPKQTSLTGTVVNTVI